MLFVENCDAEPSSIGVASPGPEIVACPGWLAGRRFVCTEAPTVFLAIYELEDAERPFNSPEFDQAVGWDEHLPKLRGYHGFRIYRRDEVIPLS